MGLTLRDGSRDYFYKQLDKSFAGVKEKYEKSFGLSYNCNSPRAESLYKMTYQMLKDYKIDTKMKFYKPFTLSEEPRGLCNPGREIYLRFHHL